MSNGNLDFITELGIGQEPNVEDTELTQEENTDQDNSNDESFVQDSETDSETEVANEDTEPNSEMEELRKMVEGMEKRIADKDEYIEKLRQESQAKEQSNDEGLEEDVVDEEEDFWDNPVEKFNELKKTIQIQQMQIQETVYANTVDGYWETVNQDALKEAVATDTDFANTFNSSKEPYKVAYEYLSAKKEQSKASEQSLREKIREEERQKLMSEMKKGTNKEAVPSMKNIGSNSGSSNQATEDGFAAIFGSN